MWHRPSSSVFLYVSEGIKNTGYVAGFDMDWTLARSYRGFWPKDPSDIKLMARRTDKLRELQERGWTIVVFTNQKSTTDNKVKFNFERVNHFIKLVGLDLILVMATGTDKYRKPDTGMYELVQKVLGPIKKSFYCGDAAGRTGDFSDSDKIFSQNLSIKFYEPEHIFPNPTIEIPTERCMIVFVGMPGVGKTTYYSTYLKPLNYHHVNQDTLGSKAKCLRVTRDACQKGQCVAIDCTNPGLSRREEFYSIGSKYNYNLVTIFFEGDGRQRNKLRPDPVPTIGYSMYYKYLVEPTPENTPGHLYILS